MPRHRLARLAAAATAAAWVLAVPASAGPDCSGSQYFGGLPYPAMSSPSGTKRVLVATDTMGRSQSTAGWLAITTGGAFLWEQPVTLGVVALGRRVVSTVSGPVATSLQGLCADVLATSVDVATGENRRSIRVATRFPSRHLRNPNIFEAGVGDFDGDGRPDQAVETRVQMPDEGSSLPVDSLSHNGRDITLTPRSGTVAVLSASRGKTLFRWDYDGVTGPGPLSGFTGSTFTLIKGAAQVGAGFEYDAKVEGYRGGRRIWVTKQRLLRDGADVLAGPLGPLLITTAPSTNAGGQELGIASRVVALDGRSGQRLWQRDWARSAPTFARTSRGDLMGSVAADAGQPNSVAHVVRVDGRTGATRFDTTAPFNGTLADLTGDGLDDALFTVGYVNGQSGGTQRASTTAGDTPSLTPIGDVDGDGGADVWSYSGSTHIGSLLHGRSLTPIWQVPENPVPFIRSAKPGNRVPRQAVTADGRKLVVVFREIGQRLTAFDAATGKVIWEYRHCTGLDQLDAATCATEP